MRNDVFIDTSLSDCPEAVLSTESAKLSCYCKLLVWLKEVAASCGKGDGRPFITALHARLKLPDVPPQSADLPLEAANAVIDVVAKIGKILRSICRVSKVTVGVRCKELRRARLRIPACSRSNARRGIGAGFRSYGNLIGPCRLRAYTNCR